MSTVVGSDLEAMLSGIGRAWGWILAFGVITILAGLAAIFWPGATLVAIAIVFAVQLILGAVFRFVSAFALPGESGWLRALQAILAILSFVVGIYLLGHIALSLLLLALLLGVYWMFHGIVELFVAIGHAELPGRAWLILTGVLSIVAGVILVLAPGISLFTLTLVLGVWLVVFGVILAVRALQIRGATAEPGARAAAT
ncbi:MAG: HdeD family acid-resistance protein [Chloroflexi bacterium]|nr:MAG: HdeD family acid-resistance protein [Chloroflexota bacterium]